MQSSLLAQQEAARAVDLARTVAAVGMLGLRPDPALLRRLLDMGPCLEIRASVMDDLHRVITMLLDEPHAQPGSVGEQVTGVSSPRVRDMPSEGASDAEFDAFVDAARELIDAECCSPAADMVRGPDDTELDAAAKARPLRMGELWGTILGSLESWV